MIGQQFGQDVVEAGLGSGAFGRVLRARHAASGYVRALKVPHDEAYLRDFAEEARLLDQLRHRNEDLATALQRGRMPWEEALRTADQVLQALETAHSPGIYHRDIKPANVMLRADGVAKLADFGLGRVVARESRAASLLSLSHGHPVTTESLVASTGTQSEEAAASLVGTWAYMAPEQQADGTADARSDLYSVGVVLYEMLAGERPHLSRDMPGPSEGAKGVPEWLDEVVLSCFNRPDRRSQTAAELRSRWERWRAHQVTPVRGTRDGTERRLECAAPSPPVWRWVLSS